MYVEAGGTGIEGSMFQILSNVMIEREGNLMKKGGVENGFYCTVIEGSVKEMMSESIRSIPSVST
jgi:hypothetical protein